MLYLSSVTFEAREEAVGIGQPDSTAKYGIGEGRSGEVLEDDYGIAVIPERFVDIVTGVDPSKFAGGTGRIGEEVMRRGLGFGVAVVSSTSGGLPAAGGKRGTVRVRCSDSVIRVGHNRDACFVLKFVVVSYVIIWSESCRMVTRLGHAWK